MSVWAYAQGEIRSTDVHTPDDRRTFVGVRSNRAKTRTSLDGNSPDRGSSLLELLVTVGLLGTAGVGVLALFGSSIRSSATSEQLAAQQAWLSSAADLLTGPLTTYVHCDADPRPSYQLRIDQARPVLGWPPDAVRVLAVEHWDEASSSWSGTVCTAATDPLQRVVLEADDGTRVRRLEVAKLGKLP
jgi:type II secretory pathway pseudopilin PulG